MKIGWIAFILALMPAGELRPEPEQSLGTQLVEAIRLGDVGQTRTRLAAWKATGKPWPNGPDDKPLLFLAIEGREKAHPEIVEMLLENGAKVDARGPEGMTALHWAVSHGYPERTAQILKHHPQLEAVDEHGRTPLLLCHTGAAEILIPARPNLLALDKDGMSALHYAARNGGRHLGLLFDAGFKTVDARSNAGLTPLHIAAAEGTDGAAAWLLDHGADVNAVSAADYDYLGKDLAPGYGYEYRIRRGSTPLSIAAKRKQETKWSSGRYNAIVDLLKARGGKGGSIGPGKLGLLSVGGAVAIVPFAAVFFAGLLLLDAQVSGWHSLAKKFPASAEPANLNPRQNGGVGAISLIQVRGLIRAAADKGGLYFAFPKFLRLGHPPLQIPWRELRVTRDKHLLGRRVLHLQVGEPKVGQLYLRGGVADRVAERLGWTQT